MFSGKEKMFWHKHWAAFREKMKEEEEELQQQMKILLADA